MRSFRLCKPARLTQRPTWTRDTEANPIDTLQGQLSGYGADRRLILRFYDQAVARTGGKALDEWEHDDLAGVVDAFVDVRFPTVIVWRGGQGLATGTRARRGRGDNDKSRAGNGREGFNAYLLRARRPSPLVAVPSALVAVPSPAFLNPTPLVLSAAGLQQNRPPRLGQEHRAVM